MNFGLSQEIFDTIIRYISVFPEIEEAIIFGSRAMGNFKPASDIDIAIKGNLKDSTASQLWAMLDVAPSSPYKFDVLDYGKLSNIELKKHIDEHGISIFKR